MVGMIINISDRKDTKFLLYNNTLSVEIKFHWQIIAFFLLYRWHSYINNIIPRNHPKAEKALAAFEAETAMFNSMKP